MHIATSLNTKKGGKKDSLIEGSLKGGEWCQFLLFDKIYDKRLRNTIVNWTVNSNFSSELKIQFYETNKTQKLEDSLMKGIQLKDSYRDPLLIEDSQGNMVKNTRMLYNFSHVLFIYNPTNQSTPQLFSITYQQGVL